MQRSGFSIVEIMVVMAAVAILAMIGLPRFINLKERNLLHNLDQIFTVCSYLQQKAISKQAELTLSFDTKEHSYSYQSINNRSRTVSLGATTMFGFIDQVLGPPARPTEIISQPLTFPQKITFFADGSISGGTVYLVDNKKKTMVALTCSPHQVSYIRKYRYHDNKWTLIK